MSEQNQIEEREEIVLLAVSMPEKLRHRFRLVCTKQKLSMAEVVREMIRRYAKKSEKDLLE